MNSVMRQGASWTRGSVGQVALSSALARSTGARRALIIALRETLSSARLWPLIGTVMPIPAPVYPRAVSKLIFRSGLARRCGRPEVRVRRWGCKGGWDGNPSRA